MLQPRTAKIALFVMVVSLAIGVFYAYAQIQTTVDQPVSMSLQADSVQTLIPVQDIGVIKEGKANLPLTLSGNVLIVVNNIRVTADSAVVHFGSNVIELNGGSARIELPGSPTSVGIRDRR